MTDSIWFQIITTRQPSLIHKFSENCVTNSYSKETLHVSCNSDHTIISVVRTECNRMICLEVNGSIANFRTIKSVTVTEFSKIVTEQHPGRTARINNVCLIAIVKWKIHITMQMQYSILNKQNHCAVWHYKLPLSSILHSLSCQVWCKFINFSGNEIRITIPQNSNNLIILQSD